MGCVQSKQSVQPDLPQAKLRENVSMTPSMTESSTPSSEESVYRPTTSGAFYNEPDRLASVAALGCLGTHPDQRFVTITKLMASVFKVPVALVTILGQSDCFFKSNVGALAGATHRPRENTFCDAIMVPDVPEVLVVEDALQDARFSRIDGVISDPHMRFYAGAPLIGADGYRYGTLCVVDFRPRNFPAGLYNTLMNFAELVVREMERDRVLELRAQSFEAAHALLRSPAAYSQAVALVDVSCGRWDILYANPLWAAAVGVPAEECPQDTLWDQYCVADSVQSTLMEAALAEGRPVDIRVLKLSGDGDDIDDLRVRTLTLRPAAVDALEASVPVGVPAFVAPGGMQRCSVSTSDSGSGSVNSSSMAKCLWFAVLQQQVAEQKRTVEEAAVSAECEAFNNAVGGMQEEEAEQAQPDLHEAFLEPPRGLCLELGALIGSGAHAKVFRATYRGIPAAAKVIDLGLHAAALLLNTAQLKAVLTARTLDHPHIVKTLDFSIATEDGSSACSTPRVSVSTPRSNPSTPRAGAAREHRTLWIVQEYCNRGMLNDACDRGLFRVERSPTGAPHMRYILRTAIEVAGAVRYLHGKGLVQGLNSKSVLLTASTKDDRGFQAMLGSSALPGLMGARHSRLGTVSHMSPELLLDGLSTPAADVYAFGVMLWEMYCGGRAWAGRSPAQVVELISMGHAVLPLPEATPPKFAQLVAQCMEFDHTKRPSMDGVFEAIIGMLVAC